MRRMTVMVAYGALSASLGAAAVGLVAPRGVAERQSPGAALLAGAREAVALELSDPESARFRDVRAVGGWAVCGLVNSRNSFGGYVGFRPFAAVTRGSSSGQAVVGDEDFVARRLTELCASPEAMDAQMAKHDREVAERVGTVAER